MKKILVLTGVMLLVTAFVIVAMCITTVNMGLLNSEENTELGDALGGVFLLVIGLLFAISWIVAIILLTVFGIVFLKVDVATVKTKKALVGLCISMGILGVFYYIANVLIHAAATALNVSLLGTLIVIGSVIYLATFIVSLVAHGKVKKFLKSNADNR